MITLRTIKHELEVNAIQPTYNDVLKRATLENRVIKLGILNMRVRRELSSLCKVSAGDEYYPQPEWGDPKVNIEKRNQKNSCIFNYNSINFCSYFSYCLEFYYKVFHVSFIVSIILGLLISFIAIWRSYNSAKKPIVTFVQ